MWGWCREVRIFLSKGHYHEVELSPTVGMIDNVEQGFECGTDKPRTKIGYDEIDG